MNPMNPLDPQGFTGFGAGYYAQPAAWPEDARPQVGDDVSSCAVRALNRLGYLGPGAWADAEGGLIAVGCLDADL
jgi:hypothetical protein